MLRWGAQMIKHFKLLTACLLSTLAGCDSGGAYSPREPVGFQPMPAAKRARNVGDGMIPPRVQAEAFGHEASATRAPSSPAIALASGGEAPQPEAAAAAGPAISRKIIYDAQVDLTVDSVDPVAKKVTSLVQGARGYIAEQNVTGSPGTLRSIHWRIRIPVDGFDSFVESVVALGELERNNRTSQDVSEQYYDIEARIKNKKVEEQTLHKILNERSGKLEDVLKIEVELSRVRGEIEQLEGKIRVLENLSSLATLTLNVREREKFAPPAPVVAGFGTQISRAWENSVTGLVNLGKAIVIWVVSWAIWLPIILVGVLVAWVLIRRLIRWFIRNLPRLVELGRTPIRRPGTPAQGG